MFTLFPPSSINFVFLLQGVRDILKVFLEKCQAIEKLVAKDINFLPQLEVLSEVSLFQLQHVLY